MSKQTDLDIIAAAILEENICSELAATATQLVFGSGNPDADIVFIGEAPGKKEDETGVPFVGAAGKFLDEMLGSIDLNRDDIYITNIVKYRPPNNRDPLPEEKKAFLPFLVRQLEVIKPQIVVTLGRHSMEVFLPGLTISTVHGQPKRIRLANGKVGELSVVVLPLFHPAAALYNGGLRQTLLDDFATLPLVISKLKKEKK